MNRKDIYVSKGTKAWWKLIFPALCFSFTLYAIFQSFNYEQAESTPFGIVILVSLLTTLPLIVLGIVFSMVKDFHFDFIQKKYKIVKRVGPLGFGKWRKFEALNYISVYKNSDDLFEIKLWYNGNRHYSIDVFKNDQDAIKKGKELAKNLSINIHTPNTDYVYSEDESEPVEIPENLRIINAHISEGTRPLWQTITAALFYTGAFVSLYLFYETFSLDINKKRLTVYFDFLQITEILIVLGISFSVVKDYQFDFKNNQYKIIHRIGSIRVGKWRNFQSLDYISVFKKSETKYLVNLWYNRNKHFSFGMSNKPETALNIGSELSKKLKIDLLDATDPHNSKWVDNLIP